MNKIIPLIVSHEPLMRLGMRRFLEEEVEMRQCLEAATPADALNQQAAHQPALVLLCVCQQQMDAVRLIRDLRRKRQQQAVLVVSRKVEADHVSLCLRAGALGYVCSQDPLQELRMACAAVLRGDIHVSRQAAQGLRAVLSGPRAMTKNGQGMSAAAAPLSEREREVFALVGDGCGSTEIARKLSISVKTVETHQQRIKVKLGVERSAELRRLAVARNGR
jgi:DNA-binding NarL/FixJ family response regulator